MRVVYHILVGHSVGVAKDECVIVQVVKLSLAIVCLLVQVLGVRSVTHELERLFRCCEEHSV